jgi:hypothetical protein
MLARLLLILPIMLPSASVQVATYSVAGPNDSPSIVTLRHKLDSGGAAAVKNFWDAVAPGSRCGKDGDYAAVIHLSSP